MMGGDEDEGAEREVVRVLERDDKKGSERRSCVERRVDYVPTPPVGKTMWPTSSIHVLLTSQRRQ